LAERYSSHYSTPEDAVRRDELFELERKSEKYIFEHTSLQPEEITADSVNDTISSLRKWQI
jgi:hypothetical protein